DHGQRRTQLLSAVTAQAVEDIPGEAFAVDPDKNVRDTIDFALDHRHVVLVVDQRAVANGGEIAELGRQCSRYDPLDQTFVTARVGDQIGDLDHLQAVVTAVCDQVRHPGHAAVLVHHFADHAGGVEAGKTGEIDRRFGVAGALQD